MIAINSGRLLGLFALLTIAPLVGAQSTIWAKRLEYMGKDDQATGLVVDVFGNVYVSGSTAHGTDPRDVLVAKYDAAGNRQWARAYNSPWNGDDTAGNLAGDIDGNVILLGNTTSSTGGNDILLLKYDPSGRRLWTRRIDGPGHGLDIGDGIATDDLGDIYLATMTTGDGTGPDATVMKYSADGVRLWARSYDHMGGSEGATRVAVDSSLNVYVLGTAERVGTGSDLFIRKLGPDGNLLWTKFYDGPAHLNELPDALAIDSQGNVVVTATSYASNGLADIVILKFSPSGSTIFSRAFGRANDSWEAASHLCLDSSDNLLIGATVYREGGGYGYQTLKYSSSGSLLWWKTYDGPVPGGSDRLMGIAVDASGNAYVTGSSTGQLPDFEGTDYATIKYAPDGTRKWARRYNGSSNLHDRATRIAVAPDGNVVVTGTSYLASIDVAPDSDIFTIKYSAGP